MIRKISIVSVLIAALLFCSGFKKGPITVHDSSVATAGEVIVVVEGSRAKQFSGYVKCISGTVLVSGWDNDARKSPLDPTFPYNYASHDSLTTVVAGDIIPFFGKFTHVWWKGDSATADAILMLYQD